MIAEAEVLRALRELRADSVAVAASARTPHIRIAMHAEVARRARRRWWTQLVQRMWRPRLSVPVAAAAAAAAAVLAAGWSSPAGSPLHAIVVARQAVQLSLPGADRAELLLGWSESDLRDAHAGTNRRSQLAEAAALLDECRPYVAASPALLRRWTQDDTELAVLTGQGGAADGMGSARSSGDDGVPSRGGPSGESGDDGSASSTSGVAPGSEPSDEGAENSGSAGSTGSTSTSPLPAPSPDSTSGDDGGSIGSSTSGGTTEGGSGTTSGGSGSDGSDTSGSDGR